MTDNEFKNLAGVDLNEFPDSENAILIENGARHEPYSKVFKRYKFKGSFDYHLEVQVEGMPRQTPSRIEINAYTDDSRRHRVNVNYKWVQLDRDGESCDMHIQINKYEVSPRDIGRRIRVLITRSESSEQQSICIFEYGPVDISEYLRCKFLNIRDTYEQSVPCQISTLPTGEQFNYLHVDSTRVMPYRHQERGHTYHLTVESYCSPSLVDGQAFKIVPYHGVELAVRMNTREDRDLMIMYVKQKVKRIREDMGMKNEKFCSSFFEYSLENINYRVQMKEEYDMQMTRLNNDVSFNSSNSPLMISLDPRKNAQTRYTNIYYTSQRNNRSLLPVPLPITPHPVTQNNIVDNIKDAILSFGDGTLSPDAMENVRNVANFSKQIQSLMPASKPKQQQDAYQVVGKKQNRGYSKNLPLDVDSINEQGSNNLNSIFKIQPTLIETPQNQGSEVALPGVENQGNGGLDTISNLANTFGQLKSLFTNKSSDSGIKSQLESYLVSMAQNLVKSPEAASLADEMMRKYQKGVISSEEMVTNLQKLATQGQAQAKKSFIKFQGAAEDKLDEIMKMGSEAIQSQNKDGENQPSFLGSIMKKLTDFYHFGIGEGKTVPPIALEDLAKASDEVDDLQNKNKELMSKLLEISLGVGVGDSAGHALATGVQMAEIELKDNSIKLITKEKEGLRSELDELKKTNAELEASLNQERNKLRTKEQDLKTRQLEWLIEKEELETKLIEAEAYKSKVEGLKNTIRKTNAEKQSLIDEIDHIKNSRFDESGGGNSGVVKLLKKKLEKAVKENNDLIDQLEVKTQELLEQELQSQNKIYSLTNQLNSAKKMTQTYGDARAEISNQFLTPVVGETSFHIGFVNELVKALVDYHDLSLPARCSETDILDAIEKLAFSHLDEVTELKDQIKNAKTSKVDHFRNVGDITTEFPKLDEKDKEIEVMNTKVRRLEAELKYEKESNAVRQSSSYTIPQHAYGTTVHYQAGSPQMMSPGLNQYRTVTQTYSVRSNQFAE